MNYPQGNDFHTQGAVPLRASSYVERAFEERALRHLLRSKWVLLLGPRQHGKTTGLVRLKQKLQEQGLRVAGVDFQMLSPSSASTYKDLLRWVADHLASSLGTEGYTVPTGQNAEEFASWLACVLPDGDEKVVVYMDEAASVPKSMLNNFYGQIRGISTTIAEPARTQLHRVSFLFSGMFQPETLVNSQNSPFNTCERVETDDLDVEQARTIVRNVLGEEELNEDDEGLVQRAFEEVGGQPYLLQHVLSTTFDAAPIDRLQVLSETVEELTYSDHMVAVMERVVQDEAIQNVAAELARSKPGKINLQPDPSHKHLCVVGLAGRQGATLVFRNALYARVAQGSPHLLPAEDAATSATPLVPLPEERFAFVKDEEYREFAYTAQKGAAHAYNAGSFRLAVIGYGSALEAILMDWLVSVPAPDLLAAVSKAEKAHKGKNMWSWSENRNQPKGWRLVNLIKVADQVGGLSGAADIKDKLREFRNWVHPSRAIALGLEESELEPEARAACATFDAVIRDVERVI